MAVGTESPGTEWHVGWAEGMAVPVDGEGRRIGEVSLVSFVEGDNKGEVPEGLEGVVSQSIVCFVECGYLYGIVQKVEGFVEGEQACDRVMSSGIGKA